MVPDNITKEHILKAIEEIDSEGVRSGRQSSTYDLKLNEKFYPPKYVISLANKYANGEELDHNSFSGGIGTPAFNLLEKYNFKIIEKIKESSSDEFDHQAIIGAIEISRAIVDNGLSKLKIVKNTPEYDKYNNIIKAQSSVYEAHFGVSSNLYIKKILEKYFSQKQMSDKYEVKSFGYWGRVLRPYAWGCIYLKNNKKSTPASYSPQLYIVIDEDKIRFGFSYGDHLNQKDNYVKEVIANQTLVNEISILVKSKKEVHLYDIVKGDNLLTRGFENKIELNSSQSLIDLWGRGCHLSSFIPYEEIDDNLFSKLFNTFDQILPIFEEICSFRNVKIEKNIKKESKKYWLFAPGRDASKWEEFYDEGIMAIGWDSIGNLESYNSKKDIRDAMISQEASSGTDFKNDSLCCFDFIQTMNIGDVIICKKGRHSYIGYGVVTSDYQYYSSRDNYPHIRRVNWIKKGQWSDSKKAIVLKTLTDITKYPDYVERLKELLGMDEETQKYSINDATSELFMPKESFKEYLNILKTKKNIVLQGPPGVGKTFISKRLAYCLLGEKDDSKVKMIQFHQSYSYEDFIQGFRPTEDGGFKLTNGVFYKLCAQAESDPDSKYVLIIDEINRGNLSKIFGELLMLIESDKREQTLSLTYSPDTDFSVPKNLYLIGTMNTADRSIAMVDYALRRRFSFIPLSPEFNVKFKEHLISSGFKPAFCNKIISGLNALNDEIKSDKNNLGDGYQIGHSYFCPDGDGPFNSDWYNNKIKYEIEPLLKEYWFDELERVESLVEDLTITD